MCPMVLHRFLQKPIGCAICDFVSARTAKVRMNWLDNMEWPLQVEDMILASDANGISRLTISSQIEYKAKIQRLKKKGNLTLILVTSLGSYFDF